MLTSPAPQPLDQVKANTRYLVLDVLWFGVALPSTARFLSVYAIRLDASPTLLGWLTALPAIIALGTSALAEWWRRHFRNDVQAATWIGLPYRLMFLLPAFTALFPSSFQTTWLLLAVAIPAFMQGISGTVFLVMMRNAVPPDAITGVISRRALAFNIAVAISTLIYGFWLEHVAFPHNYQVMYVSAFGFSLISLWAVTRVRMPENAAPVVASGDERLGGERAGLRPLLLMLAVTYGAALTIAPIIPLRLVDELGASEGFMSYFALAELGAAAAAAALTDRLVRRFGALPVTTVGIVVAGLAILPLALSTSLVLALVSGSLSGATWTAATIAMFGYYTAHTASLNATRVMRLYNQVIMLSFFVGPMLGSQLAETALSLSAVLLIGAVLRVASAGMILAVSRARSAATPTP